MFGMDHFWEHLYDNILSDLRLTRILRSGNQNAGFQRPGTLRYVPTTFRYRNDILFALPEIRQSHLAFNYDNVRNELELLGVEALGISGLYGEFRDWITKVGARGMRAQSTEWHRKVASVFCGQESLRYRLSNLPIIPLRGGLWVTARTEHVFLAPSNRNEHVPSGVSISIVDKTASRDPQRKQFFRFLGIEEYSPRRVCDLILELHADSVGSLSDREDGDLLDDLTYLFDHRSLLKHDGAPRIVFLAQWNGETLRKKTGMYITDPRTVPCLVNKYRDTPGNPFPILDDRYQRAICGDDDRKIRSFHKWLLRSANSFTTVPRLIRKGKLTPEYKFLRDTNVTDLLYAVKFHLKTSRKSPMSQALSDAVPRLKVRCQDGITRRLRGLALPSRELLRECPHLDFADLPGPRRRKRWGFLSKFGVLTSRNTTAVLQELRALSRLALDQVDEVAVHNIYRALSSSRFRDDEDAIR